MAHEILDRFARHAEIGQQAVVELVQLIGSNPAEAPKVEAVQKLIEHDGLHDQGKALPAAESGAFGFAISTV